MATNLETLRGALKGTSTAPANVDSMEQNELVSHLVLAGVQKLQDLANQLAQQQAQIAAQGTQIVVQGGQIGALQRNFGLLTGGVVGLTLALSYIAYNMLNIQFDLTNIKQSNNIQNYEAFKESLSKCQNSENSYKANCNAIEEAGKVALNQCQDDLQTCKAQNTEVLEHSKKVLANSEATDGDLAECIESLKECENL